VDAIAYLRQDVCSPIDVAGLILRPRKPYVVLAEDWSFDVGRDSIASKMLTPSEREVRTHTLTYVERVEARLSPASSQSRAA